MSLACFDASFAAGLIEAATQTLASGNPVVLIAYDTPYPQPLHATRPISASFGVALVVAGNRTNHSLAELEISIVRAGTASTPIANTGLESLRLGIPTARSLPLLTALAALTFNTEPAPEKIPPDRIYLDYIAGNQLEVVAHPC